MSLLIKTVRKISDSTYCRWKSGSRVNFFSAVHTNEYHSLVVESWAHVWLEFLLNTWDTQYLVPIINNSNNNNNNNTSAKHGFMQELYPWEIPKSWYPFPWTYSNGFFVMLPGNSIIRNDNIKTILHGFMEIWTSW